MKVKFGDVVRDVKSNVDRTNNPYEFYVAGDHMDTEDFHIHRRGSFATDDVGPAFVRIFHPGQVLYGSRRTYLKKVCVADFDGICSNTTFVLETKDEEVLLQRLLPFLMLSDSFTDWSIKHSKGSTNPYILFSDLAAYEFSLPPIDRQRELADLLWAANDLKEAYKKAISSTNEMLKAIFRERVKEIESKVQLGSITQSYDSRRIPIKSGDRRPGPYPYYGASGVVDHVDKYIFDEDILLISEDGANLLTRVTPIAFSVSGKCWVNNHAHVVKFSNMATQRFVEFYLEHLDLRQYITGTAQPKLNQEKLNEILIPLPPLSLQREFVVIADAAEKAKAALNRSLGDLEQVMKGLING